MFSLFPEILFLAPFSAFLIRISLGLLFAYAAWQHVGKSDALSRGVGAAEGILAALLIGGAWTQAAALAALVFVALYFAVTRLRTFPLSTTLLFITLSLSLLVTGAGPFAFDLPL